MSPTIFEILGVQTRFDLTSSELERALRRQFVARSTEGPLALERVNEAYRSLKDSIARAEALFVLRGWSTQSPNDVSLIESVFEERQDIERAKSLGDVAFLENWVSAARKRRGALESTLGQLLDGTTLAIDVENSSAEAARCLSELRYLVKALAAAESALDDL